MRGREIIQWIEKLAPLALAEEWDNSGLLVGTDQEEVTGVLVALDVNEGTVDEALKCGANLIVAHHPLIFKPMASVTDETALGRCVTKLMAHHISVYASHTNFDSATGGLCDSLCEKIGLGDTVPLSPAETDTHAGLGRIGDLDETITLSELSERILKITGQKALRVVGDQSQKVRRIAVANGSGADFAALAAKMGARVLVTGDVKYHEAQAAQAMGLSLIDGGHFGTEKHFIGQMADYLSSLDVKVYQTETAKDVFDWVIREDEKC